MAAEPLVLAAAMAVAAGLVGCFAVMRRMALAADGLSHVALPGISLALALHINPFLGASTMLFFGALLVWSLDDPSRGGTETIVGVVFSVALAAGSMMTTGERLIDALFGAPIALSRAEEIAGITAAALVIAFVIGRKDTLVLALISPDLARTAGVNVRRLNLVYLEMFALTVALGLRYLGVLLMGSLIIIPAATARRLSKTLNEMLMIAAAAAVVATIAGSLVGARLHRDTGPLIVSISATGFLLSLFTRRA